MDLKELKIELLKISKKYKKNYIGTALNRLEYLEVKESLFSFTSFLGNNVSISERIYCIVNNIKSLNLCIICNKNKTRFYNNIKGYGLYCGKKCLGKSNKVKEKRKSTNLKKIGYEFPIQSQIIKNKIKNTSIQRYGFDNPAKSKIIKEKIAISIKSKKNYEIFIIKIKTIVTNIIKYGVTNPMKNFNTKNKIKNTNIQRYGFDNPMKNEFIKNKRKLTIFSKYNKEYYSQTENYKNIMLLKRNKRRKEKLYKKYISIIDNLFTYNITKNDFQKKFLKGPYKLICKNCKNIIKDTFIFSFENNRFARCFKCNPLVKGYSKKEKELLAYINKLIKNKVNIIENDKKILNGKELDIYLPNNKLAIEYNGLMWHSIGKHKSSKFNNYLLESEIKNKHLHKTEECQKRGIQLLHIFENEWIDKIKQEIWKNIISNKLGLTKNKIYGRNTYIKLVSNELSKDFLNLYHLQGNTPSKIKIGLFDKQSNDLLSIMTFGKSRFDKKVDWELLRFTTKNGYNIIGGASKIFKYFVNNYLENGQSIKTYADLRFSNGDIYKKLGFKLVGQSNTNYFYFKNGSLRLYSRQSFQKHKLKDKLEIFDKNLTESENMYNNGYRKIYDCGNLDFIYKKN